MMRVVVDMSPQYSGSRIMSELRIDGTSSGTLHLGSMLREDRF